MTNTNTNIEAPNGKTRTRTRTDPFAETFDSDVVPLLKRDVNAKLHVRTILEELMVNHPGEFSRSHLRTLGRRVKEWREGNALGPEAYIPQRHPPGLEAQIDFTNGTSLGVTICGAPYPHKIGHFVLSHSGARYAQTATGESFPATLHLIQAALREMGGSPKIIRSDGLPACVQHGRPVQGYLDFLKHYQMRASVINAYCPHENGVVEQANFRLKVALDQALIVRGSRDFASQEEYGDFIKKVVGRYNRRPEIQEKLEAERARLRRLPAEPAPIYDRTTSLVTKFSLIRVKGGRYSVPSRLINMTVEVRIFDERLEVYHGDTQICTWGRVEDQTRVDYHHVIEWLVRKPGSFARCEYRDQLFPTQTFRQAHAVLRRAPGIGGDAEYLRILQLATKTEEEEVETALELLLEKGVAFTAMDVWEIMAPPGGRMPSIPGYQLDMNLPDAA